MTSIFECKRLTVCSAQFLKYNISISAEMSNNTSPSKGRGSTGVTEVNSIMPLLFATLGNPSINFKKMAAMDTEGRSDSALEHKFRRWRHEGRAILENHPEHAGKMDGGGSKKPRAAPSKKGANGKGKAKQADVGDEEDAVDEEAGAFATAQEEDGAVSRMMTSIKHCRKAEKSQAVTNPESSPTPAKKARAKRGTKATAEVPVRAKKRGSQDMTADADDEETPVKKPRVNKKGTAKVVKKSAVKEEEKPSENEEEEKVDMEFVEEV